MKNIYFQINEGLRRKSHLTVFARSMRASSPTVLVLTWGLDAAAIEDWRSWLGGLLVTLETNEEELPIIQGILRLGGGENSGGQSLLLALDIFSEIGSIQVANLFKFLWLFYPCPSWDDTRWCQVLWSVTVWTWEKKFGLFKYEKCSKRGTGPLTAILDFQGSGYLLSSVLPRRSAKMALGLRSAC